MCRQSGSMTRNGLSNVEDARDIGPEQLLPLLRREILQRRAELHARIIDQDISGSDRLLDLGDTFTNGFGAGYVEARHRDFMPAGLETRRRSVELAAIAPVQDHGGAMLGKSPRDRQSDALRRSRDERTPAGEIKQFECQGRPS